MSDIQKLREIIDRSKSIVFFGGAGVSTESGIPDFRSQDGLYNSEYAYPPEEILSHHFFKENTAEFYRFYRAKMLYPNAEPSFTHRYLARLESEGKLTAVVTQNIDGLHQAAGSKAVYELHGSVMRNFCTRCKRAFGVEKMLESTGIPWCDCGGVIKPDVVLYGEQLDDEVVDGAIKAIERADTLIIGGTSLVVYPAAGLVNFFTGDNLVIINKSPTAADTRADILISAPLGETFKEIDR